jgi:integrase/recombinase XerD
LTGGFAVELDKLFDLFIQEKTYLQNCSPNSLRYFRQCYAAYKRFVGAENPTREVLNTLVIRMRQSGMSAGCCNSYLKGINTFLKWLRASEYIEGSVTIKLLKKEKRIMRSFSEEELRRLITFRPRTRGEARLHALLCFLIDTRTRIDEALTLTRDKINWDSLTATVFGKGSKERIVPLSIELRKVLFKHLKTHTFDRVFCTRDGSKLDYFNVHKEFRDLCVKLGIKPEGFHCFRSRNYLKLGANLFTCRLL